MKIKDVILFMSFDSGFKDPFRDNFNLGANFINDYISRNIRLLKIETDGTYNMICIEPCVDDTNMCSIKGEKSLNVRVNFDKDFYLSLREDEQNSYCLDLINEGYEIASKFRSIDVSNLSQTGNEFKDRNFTNKWRFKKKKFNDNHLEVELICEFSRQDFKLRIIISDTKTKEILLNNILIRTLPDKVCFKPLFKDIKIINNQLVVTEFQNRPKFIFKLQDVYDKKFIFEVTDVGLAYNKLEK
nr:hypothetical protein [uncultured Flavobacterium sp.]